MTIKNKTVVGKLFLSENDTPIIVAEIIYDIDEETGDISNQNVKYYNGDKITKSGLFSSGNETEIKLPRNIKISPKDSEIRIIFDGGFFGKTETLLKFDTENGEFYTGDTSFFSNTKKVLGKIEFENDEDFVLNEKDFEDVITSLGYFVWQELKE